MSYSSEVLADSPVGYWHLDESSGTSAADSSGNSRNGTYVNSPTLSATSLLTFGGGTAVSLLGSSSQRCTVASNSAFNMASGVAGFTFECWVKITTPTSAALQVIADKTNLSTSNGQWVVYWDNRNIGAGTVLNLRFRHDAGTILLDWSGTTARDALAAGGHLACVLDATTARIYWNGTQVASIARGVTGIIGTTQTLSFGATSAGANFLTGKLDEPAIYQSALSSTRVAAHYAAGTSADTTVAAPLVTTTTDVLDPTVASGITVTAPLVTTTSDALDPTVSSVTPVTVTAPIVTATTDALDPTVSAATPVTVAAPVVTTTSDALDPTVTTPSGTTIAVPTLTATTDALDPSVTSVTPATVTAPLVTTTTDALEPTVSAAASPATVSAPLLTTTTDALNPAFVVPAVTTTPMTLDFTAGASLTVGSIASVTPLTIDLTAGASLNVVIPRGDNPDPRSGSAQWSYVITDRAGVRYGQLDKVTADPIEDGVNTEGTTAFTIAATDPKRALIPAGTVARECQVWRGKTLMHKGPILPGAPSDNGSTVTYSVPDSRWYFSDDRRVVGRIPKRNLLKNGDFSQGLIYWKGGFDPGTIPALPPLVAVVDSDESVSGKALQIKGADKSQLTIEDVKTGAVFVPNSPSYLSGGEAIIQAVGANIPTGSTVKIVGHTANNSINGDYGDGMALSLARANAAKATLLAMDGTLSITTEGHGFYEPVATNSTDDGQALNRRVVISYEGTQSATGSAQYESQTLTVSQPASVGKALTLTLVGTRDLTTWVGPNKPQYGVYIQAVKASAPTVIVDSAYSTLNEDSVRDSPQEDVATIEIPANGADYIVEVRYYAPNGVIEWYDLELTPGDMLAFPKKDQALIVKGTVEHMQDVSKGKGALGITTRTPLTGVVRSRWYPEYERQHIDSVLGEFQAINRGMDIDVIPLPTGGDVVATYFPRQGGASDMVLGPGVVARFSPANTRDVASSIIAQADGSGGYRREAYASDQTALGGLMLERVMSAENETPLKDLDDTARAELAAARLTTPAYWVDCYPKHTNAILDRIAKGDRVRAILRDGVTDVDATARVVKRRIDPNTDTVSLMIALEV